MKKYNAIIAWCLSFFMLIAVVYILYIGSFLFIPFAVALLVSFIILSLASFFLKKGLPKILSFILSLVVIVFIIIAIGQIINSNINELIVAAPTYEEKLARIVGQIAQTLDINPKIVIEQFVENVDIPNLVASTASIITSIVKNAGIIFFFTLFILLESKSFSQKLEIITGWSQSKFFVIFEQVRSDIRLFFWVKTFVSFIGAFISFCIMFVFQLDFILFWTFLIFILNYIPNFGSIIAVFFPVVFSLIQYESFPLSLVLLFFLMTAQGLSWSLIETKLMGNRLNLSPLVILISLLFWGTLWGPIWMLLSVPIMVIINITLAHIEVTRPIAVFLSEKWIVKFPGMQESKWKITLKKMKKLLGRE